MINSIIAWLYSKPEPLFTSEMVTTDRIRTHLQQYNFLLSSGPFWCSIRQQEPWQSDWRVVGRKELVDVIYLARHGWPAHLMLALQWVKHQWWGTALSTAYYTGFLHTPEGVCFQWNHFTLFFWRTLAIRREWSRQFLLPS